jgi:hypothetical protein
VISGEIKIGFFIFDDDLPGSFGEKPVGYRIVIYPENDPIISFTV